MKYLNISNLLSLCRAPLALLFIPQIRGLRLIVVVLAGASDYFDGFLARRLHKTSQLGAILDPVMDKFFMFVVIAVLLTERSLGTWEAAAMLSRDLCLALFLIFLAISGTWRGLRFRSIWWGRVITVLQYAMLLILIAGVPVPSWTFLSFPLLSLLYFGELLLYYRQAH